MISIINIYQLIGAASKTYFFCVFKSVKTVFGFDTVYKRFSVTVLLRIDKIDTRLVECRWIGRSKNSDAVHIGFGGVSVTVAVRGLRLIGE